MYMVTYILAKVLTTARWPFSACKKDNVVATELYQGMYQYTNACNKMLENKLYIHDLLSMPTSETMQCRAVIRL